MLKFHVFNTSIGVRLALTRFLILGKLKLEIVDFFVARAPALQQLQLEAPEKCLPPGLLLRSPDQNQVDLRVKTAN